MSATRKLLDQMAAIYRDIAAAKRAIDECEDDPEVVLHLNAAQDKCQQAASWHDMEIV